MPVIAHFNGIKILVYSRDHNPPHIHAESAEDEVLIEIETLEVYKGGLPSKKLRLVLDYVAKNQKELLSLFKKLNPQLP